MNESRMWRELGELLARDARAIAVRDELTLAEERRREQQRRFDALIRRHGVDGREVS